MSTLVPIIPPNFALRTYPDLNHDAPTVATFCGGAGIGTTGFRMAGYNPVLNVDFDPNNPELSQKIAAMYFANFGHQTTQQSLQDFAAQDGFKNVNADVWMFSQSCKNFSIAGKKQEHPDDLAAAQALIVGLWECVPKILVIENVWAYRNSQCLMLILEALEALGYEVSQTLDKPINCADYGVPQKRLRYILIASRIGTPELPRPTTADNQMGWYEAIADLIDEMPITQPAAWQLKRLSELDKTSLIDGRSSSFAPRDATLPSFTLGNVYKGIPRVFLIERTGANNSSLKVYSPEQPAWTIKAGIFTDHKAANRKEGINVFDQGIWKRLTGRGVARLMSLPDCYQLPSESSVWGPALGNGIPALLTEAIALCVKPLLCPNPQSPNPQSPISSQQSAISNYHQPLQAIEQVALSKLIPHPQNQLIYGDEDVSAIASQIKESGWIKPLVVSRLTGHIISGHRRWKACQILGIDAVPVEWRNFESLDAEIEALLLENAYREKSIEQRVREGESWRSLEEGKAQARMKSGIADPRLNLIQGRTNELIAERVGLKRSNYEKAAVVVGKIDQEETKGNFQAAEALRSALQKSVHHAYSKAKSLPFTPATKPPIPYRVGEICQIIRGDSELRGVRGCWAVILQIREFSILIQHWKGQEIVKAEHLESLDYTESECNQMAEINLRLYALSQKELEAVVIAVLEQIGRIRRSHLTPVEEALLATLEKTYP